MVVAKDLGREVHSLPAAIPNISVPLKGTLVTLEEISRDHIDSLWRNLDLQGKGGSLMDYLPWSLDSPASLWALVEGFRDGREFFAYAIRADPQHVNPSCKDTAPTDHSETVGMIAYLGVRPGNRELELGGLLFSPILQRSAAATEAIFLMLENACEASPAYRRVCWKCNSLNTASRRAAERVGFKYEGTFRNHMIVKGRSRDSDWFSIIDDDWPSVKAALQKWLLKENFDEEGRQIKTVNELRASLSRS